MTVTRYTPEMVAGDHVFLQWLTSEGFDPARIAWLEVDDVAMTAHLAEYRALGTTGSTRERTAPITDLPPLPARWRSS